MLESSVASEANEAHKKIAPKVKRSAFIPKVYGTKLGVRKKLRKSKKTKSFFKKHPLHASIGKDWCLFESC
jgi:hypothetical protein